jgi:hypothetical protein
MNNIKLKKSIWAEEDFEEMGWHDCKLYALAFNHEKFEIAFDIDYIIEWVSQQENDSSYKFWVAPATLIFRNVYDININLYSTDCQIQDISKQNPIKPLNANYIDDLFEYDWTIETTNGDITFKSTGYKQYIRDEPRLLDRQCIDFYKRGGISFDKMEAP